MQLSLVFRIIFIILVICLCFFLATPSASLESLNVWGLDYLIGKTKVIKTDPRLLVVGIDEGSFCQLGGWPWDLETYTRILENMDKEGPESVSFSFLLDHRNSLKVQTGGDSQGGTEVWSSAILGYQFLLPRVRMGIGLPTRGSVKDPWLKKGALNRVIPSQGVLHAVDASLPSLPEHLRDSRLGFLNLSADADGVVRRVPIVIEYMGNYYPSLVLILAARALGVSLEAIQVTFQGDHCLITLPRSPSPVLIPADGKGQMLFNYFLGPENFSVCAFHQFLKGNRSKSTKGKTVLIGPTEMNADALVSGTRLFKPAVFVQAAALDAILRHRFLSTIGYIPKVSLFLVISLLCLFISLFLSPLFGLVWVLGAMVSYLGILLYLLCAQNLLLPLAEPILLGGGVYLATMITRVTGAETEKHFADITLRRYLSQNVLREIKRRPAALKLGGDRRVITVLIADIRGFSRYCERHEAEEVVEVLNQFFTVMTEIIVKHQGTLDKYVGDQLVALFGAPASCEEREHAIQACLAAQEMLKELEVLNQQWREEKKEPIRIGIGINTGSVVVGNIGSRRMFNYTAIGKAMNICARVEALTRELDKDILITGTTARFLPSTWHLVQITKTQVKDMDLLVPVFELPMDRPVSPPPRDIR